MPKTSRPRPIPCGSELGTERTHEAPRCRHRASGRRHHHGPGSFCMKAPEAPRPQSRAPQPGRGATNSFQACVPMVYYLRVPGPHEGSDINQATQCSQGLPLLLSYGRSTVAGRPHRLWSSQPPRQVLLLWGVCCSGRLKPSTEPSPCLSP